MTFFILYWLHSLCEILEELIYGYVTTQYSQKCIINIQYRQFIFANTGTFFIRFNYFTVTYNFHPKLIQITI